MKPSSTKKVLVLGGTGAMGVYLVPELASMGYQVKVISLDNVVSDNSHITYVQANAKDNSFLYGLLQENYDAIVDFMLYSTKEFSERYEMMLSNTNHYIFLSSYRVYANSTLIKENSPRLLDVSEDKEFLATEDYALYKAKQEDILKASKFDNWTVVRPAITYSKFRYQLVTLEANTVIYRAMNKLPVILPEEAIHIQGTMSWAGDVAKMLSRLVLNPAALKETYTVATSEHHTWEEIANYYKEIIGLEYLTVDTETYLSFFDPSVMKGARYQLLYDRCFNRIIDNSKILQATGLKQSDLMPLKEGLKKELSALPKDTVWSRSTISERMDEFLKNR
ncbi:MAG: NAD-dependent epimerase/dehydratase family protein [Clostridiaceae bacterium]|jgi:nucleoside-diphosphate-sugar epimerase|nr:NAD-dependent epimerase/dehydratase family protein [Clostridiaceae bacterium]